MINIQGDSGMEVAICADSQWLMPSFFTHTPVAALDFVQSALIDARRGDDIVVELRAPTESPCSYAAPTSEAAVSWLSSRLVEAWHATRASSGIHRPESSAPPAIGKVSKGDAS